MEAPKGYNVHTELKSPTIPQNESCFRQGRRSPYGSRQHSRFKANFTIYCHHYVVILHKKIECHARRRMTSLIMCVITTIYDALLSQQLLYTVGRPLSRDKLFCFLSELQVTNWAAQ